mmetsp:Transcript_1264/g.1134  ORF Transcript_1264/g.1134 Transcript_1264/m.1134 type:complete len:107 (+) Transcript_1264:64-384(+)
MKINKWWKRSNCFSGKIKKDTRSNNDSPYKLLRKEILRMRTPIKPKSKNLISRFDKNRFESTLEEESKVLGKLKPAQSPYNYMNRKIKVYTFANIDLSPYKSRKEE